MLAITLHAKLRIPLQLPGRQGIIFVSFIMVAKTFSGFSLSSFLVCIGSACILFFKVLGFDDPFMPLEYLILGAAFDGLFRLFSLFPIKSFIIALAAGLGWMCIPLLRFLFSVITGFPFHSLSGGLLYPVLTHFLFGYTGGLLGFLISRTFIKK
jgi:hypothetical protein